MVELALHDHLDEIKLESASSGRIRIHLGLNHSRTQLEAALAQAGMPDISRAAVGLFSDDSANRNFRRVDDYLLITF